MKPTSYILKPSIIGYRHPQPITDGAEMVNIICGNLENWPYV